MSAAGGVRHATVYDGLRRDSGVGGTASAELTAAQEHKTAVYRRYKEVRAAVDGERDPAARAKLKRRAGALRAMYQEACAEVRRLDPKAVKPKAKPSGRDGGGGAALDVLMQSGALWSDLEGQSWSRLAGYTWGGERTDTGRAAQVLGRMVRDGLARCTPRQQEVLCAYYGSEDYVTELGERFGVNKSTISRIISRGLQRVSRYVTAKLLIQKCMDKDGYFDYLAFINSSQILTERQREIVFLLLAQDTSYADMAQYIRRYKSTVWYTADRAESNLRGLAVELDMGISAVKVRREDWERLTEKELAQRLGLSARFYFGTVRRGESVGDIPLPHYVVLRRLRETGDPGLTAAELGYSAAFVKKIGRKYQGLAELPDVPVEDYRPCRPRRVKLPENPFAVFGQGGAIIDCIDGATYRAIQARFGGA